LTRLQALPERPPIVVVDNASTDGSAEMVAYEFPAVRVIELPENWGAAARTLGAQHVEAKYIAFSDDDSWWDAGALTQAADTLDAHPGLALVAASIHLDSEGRLEPACAGMASSPLPAEPNLPGPPVLGFIACGAVVRRSAFLQVGGFDPRFGVGGEERLVPIDLAAAGWDLAYVDEVVAHHRPDSKRDPARRRRVVTRNDLWSAWLRRPLDSVLRQLWSTLGPALADPWTRAGVIEAFGGLGWVARARRPIPPHVESKLRMLEPPPPAGVGRT
jgi:N-acetylglucosaminyl-diphospho-decaprenol L-rhamnosyltransferase